jgi:phosphoribosylglycinamide formyltransferase 1
MTWLGASNCSGSTILPVEPVKSVRLVVCASGGGGNFQALIDARGEIGFEITCLIVDRDCGAVQRAEQAMIPVKRIERSSSNLSHALDQSIPASTDLIVLAGFMPIVPKDICEKWHRKMINTHPSLLPKFGGKGMYGVKVQEAVMAAGEELAGCTVHFVSDQIDAGETILQKAISVDYEETPWQLGGRIFLEETKLLVEAVRLLVNRLRGGGQS